MNETTLEKTVIEIESRDKWKDFLDFNNNITSDIPTLLAKLAALFPSDKFRAVKYVTKTTVTSTILGKTHE